MALKWVKIKKSYNGKHGTFLKGQTLNLPSTLISKLPKGTCQKTCAPWDANKDPNIEKIASAQAKADKAFEALEVFQDALDESIRDTKAAVEKVEATSTDITKYKANIETKKKKTEELQKKLNKSKNKKNDQKTITGLLKNIEKLETLSELLALRIEAEKAGVAFHTALASYRRALVEQEEVLVDTAKAELEIVKKKGKKK